MKQLLLSISEAIGFGSSENKTKKKDARHFKTAIRRIRIDLTKDNIRPDEKNYDSIVRIIIFLDEFEKVIGRHGLCLADIGINRAVLDSLRMKAVSAAVSVGLSILENGTIRFDFYLEDIKRMGPAIGVILSDGDVQLFQSKGYRVMAENWVKHLRVGSAHPWKIVKDIHHCLEKANLTLEDIGVSEPELAKLVGTSIKKGETIFSFV